MQTIQEKICDRLDLLPEQKLQEVLLFIDNLIDPSSANTQAKPPTSFREALREFRALVEAEGSDILEIDFFQDVRDRTPAPTKPNW